MSSEPVSDPFPVTDGYVEHPWIVSRTVEAREYQLDVARQVLAKNLLVVLPTGLGKTLVAVLAAAQTLAQGGRKVLVLAPTRPLAQQHADAFARLLRDEGIVAAFLGSIPPKKRTQLWSRARVVVATPQTIRNDVDEARYDLADVDLVVFDEAHHAVGEYAYVAIARSLLRFHNPKARVLGLTASPGSDRTKIAEVQGNLGIDGIVHRDEHHETVAPHVQKTQTEWLLCALPASIRRVLKPLEAVFQERLSTLTQTRLLPSGRPWGASRAELAQLTQRLGMRAARGGGDATTYAGLLAAKAALQAQLAIEIAETQGLKPLALHLSRLAARKDLKRGDKAFLNDPRIQEVQELLGKGIDSSHSKVEVLLRLLQELRQEKRDATAIVFTQYRDTVDTLIEDLAAAGLEGEAFVGQGRKGMSQKKQKEVLDRFRARDFPVLVSTSVGEEGIDVPQVDLVVFFEAIPSEIRAIQRRGRTGRTAAGRVVVLVAQGTRDERSLKRQGEREKAMHRLVRKLG